MKLYYYQHCPFCIRVLMLINAKKLDIECIILANDDEETPLSMINHKMVPILEKDNGEYLPESLDIIGYLDQLDTPLLPAHYEPEAVVRWIAEAKTYLRALTYPRMIQYPFKEFSTQSSRDYFERKKSKMIGPFAEHIANTQQILQDFQPILAKLIDVIKTVPTDGISWEDIHLFPYVLSLTLVPTIELPAAAKQYLASKCEHYQLPAYS
jgi:glutaredoxin 2